MLKKVEYMITGAFADYDEGSIINAYVLAEEPNGGSALLYHPKTSRESCASIEMAHITLHKGKEVYISSCQETDMFGWINIESQKAIDTLVKNLQQLEYKKIEK